MAKALSPAPPHQTVRSVFPNTAFRSSSSSGFRSLGPRGCRRYLIQLQSLVEVAIRIRFIPAALLPMLPSQVNPHALLQKPLDGMKISTTMSIVKISHPSPNASLSFWMTTSVGNANVPRQVKRLNLRPDLSPGPSSKAELGERSSPFGTLYRLNRESQKIEALFPGIYHPCLLLIQASTAVLARTIRIPFNILSVCPGHKTTKSSA